jgi:hypothetical protein
MWPVNDDQTTRQADDAPAHNDPPVADSNDGEACAQADADDYPPEDPGYGYGV